MQSIYPWWISVCIGAIKINKLSNYIHPTAIIEKNVDIGEQALSYGAKAAMHAYVLKTDYPKYKALRKSGLLNDKAHKKQLEYWRKRNA